MSETIKTSGLQSPRVASAATLAELNRGAVPHGTLILACRGQNGQLRGVEIDCDLPVSASDKQWREWENRAWSRFLAPALHYMLEFQA